jgi:hypothetical protein
LKFALIIAVLALAISGCGKSPESAKPAAAAPAAQQAPSTLPAQAGGIALAGSQCKTSPTPVISATVTEAEVGVPFYPGAKLGNTTNSTGPDGTIVAVQQETTDPPEKVLAFYRARLTAVAAGRELVGGGPPDSNGNSLLELGEGPGAPGIQILTTGSSQGTTFSIGVSCLAH